MSHDRSYNTHHRSCTTIELINWSDYIREGYVPIEQINSLENKLDFRIEIKNKVSDFI